MCQCVLLTSVFLSHGAFSDKVVYLNGCVRLYSENAQVCIRMSRTMRRDVGLNTGTRG
jgi:hypothetical protein